MTNENEQPEPPVYGPEPAPATPSSSLPVAAAPVAVGERPRWLPSRSVATIAGVAVASALLFGSGVAVGHAVDRHDDHRPDFMRQVGNRGAPDNQRPQLRNGQTQHGGGQVQPRNDDQTLPNGGQRQQRGGNQTQPRNGQMTPQSDSGRS